MVIVIARIIFTEDVSMCFDALEDGNEGALKEYSKKQVEMLGTLTEQVLKDLSKNDRRKVITIITVEVHSRDVVSKLIKDRVDNSQCFQWVSQLRYRLDEQTKDCKINICDYETTYGYEYIGNCGCLVITPLTDRCYITLTQAQRLVLGGAPAGPAGTGKTETVKDLGRAIGIIVYVFNCSDQMDYKSMGQIYKGLAQAGAWGCFDEFNRIPIEVLSVCSTQWKCILDAKKAKKERFIFEDEDILLEWHPPCNAYITMNPGYAGRTELPESLKVLFRPVAMIVPDMDMITEIMLMSEGFVEGRLLARKFMILYRLSEALLSKQAHYDWKLRAVKTTLNVAGGMRRQAPDLTEDKVLLRALRDFNLGKLIPDDVEIFTGLLNDLFPKLMEQVPRVQDLKFEATVKEAGRALALQPEDIFVLKITQLRELLEVRWSVFMLGPAGAGKTELLKTLAKSQNMYQEKTLFHVINPKAVTRNELYGYITSTREWKDGLISITFRDLANTHTYRHEWIILDGDIDAEWIESMNTVMDDNKTLTLASNERIPLTAPMRLLFEIGHMKNASPATVSRGGVIFLSDTDVNYMPFINSWIEKRENDNERSQLLGHFTNAQFAASIEYCKRNFKNIVSQIDLNQAQAVCYLLEGLLEIGEKSLGGKSCATDPKLLENLFIFATMWGLGSALLVDKNNDYRKQFDKWWREEWKQLRFPEHGLIFDYLVDPESNQIVPWTDRVDSYKHDPEEQFANILVSTLDTTRQEYMLNLLMTANNTPTSASQPSAGKHPVMFIGPAGTGKTAVMKAKLHSLDAETHSNCIINLNCFTDSMMLQNTMEGQLEKRTGRVYGPVGNKQLVYFVDDLNMPALDKYGTQEPSQLLRQIMDYDACYGRAKMDYKEIKGCQYLGAMNPTAGSFVIDPRHQRHFTTFAIQMPTQEALFTIYHSILSGHLTNFDGNVSKNAERITKASVDLTKQVADNFLPSAIKFHYLFNLRDLTNIFQGLCNSRPDLYTAPLMMVRLWAHECERVFQDRMVTKDDCDKYLELQAKIIQQYFNDLGGVDAVTERPLLWSTFIENSPDGNFVYMPIPGMEELGAKARQCLDDYNENNAAMDLVLFDMALEHICRITRIIVNPGGNALLVGVGGSGKQSLARLASSICEYETFQITVTPTYSVNDFKADLVSVYMKSGLKSIGVSWLMTDGQIVNEKFLVYINDMLASGNIPDLFAPEEKDDIINGIRNETKAAGIADTRENCYDFFIRKTRKYLHPILCFSPVGDKFRVRGRQFPALINCTSIDWFQKWPQDALIAVANKFISDIEGIDCQEEISNHMAQVHVWVDEASLRFREQDRRYFYTTPKSFLEYIQMYSKLLDRKRNDVNQLKGRLENGLDKLLSSSAMVEELQANLVKEQATVEEKMAATAALLTRVGADQLVVGEEKEKAAVEEEKCTAIATEVTEFQNQCAKDLEAAEPIIAAAEAALNSLDKGSLTELKAFASPAKEIVDVLGALMVMTGKGKIPNDRSWAQGKKLLGDVGKLLNDLLTFDKDNCPENAVAFCEKTYFIDPGFDAENIKSKSKAASGLCGWIVNVCKYFRIYQDVAPKRAKAAEAEKELAAANAKLKTVREKVADLDAKLNSLLEQFEQATEEKNNAIATAEKTQLKANMANRLVAGLADEKVRWAESIGLFEVQERNLVGDALIASAFACYIGAFNMEYRNLLVKEQWGPDLNSRSIPNSETHPLDILATEADKATWNNEGLPNDSVSVENGAIMMNAARWSLMIDPQLQGISWIRNKEGDRGLKIVSQSTPRYLDAIEQCISNGQPCVIENLPEELDAVLDPILARSLIKKGKAIKIGDKEVDYDPKFKLYLQTKLSNPHYKPEVAAQTTIVNFMVTQAGLEDQLLAIVVNKERPDLEEQKTALLAQQNQFKITLKELEDNLLYRLANAEGDILADVELIENLEITKKTSKEIQQQVAEAKVTEQTINTAREAYRDAAVRGALLYFLVDSLWILDHFYRYSMANFVVIFKKGMDMAAENTDVKERVKNIIDTACFVTFAYVAQGLFERHKLILATQLCFAILKRRGELDLECFDFLIKNKVVPGVENPLNEWLSDESWNAVQALRLIEGFDGLPDDMVGGAKRFREWYELERPEEQGLPGDLKKLPEFKRLLVIKVLRPDRMTEAIATYVKSALEPKYVKSEPFNFARSYEDARPEVPVFFVLSPGVDPVSDVEKLGEKLGFSSENGKFSNVSLGQGQEPVAEKAVESGHKNGNWVFLQNIHLTPNWTGGKKGYLEKRVEKIAEGAHADFRLYLSAEPEKFRLAGLPDVMPIAILQGSIKLTNEPPEGLQASQFSAWSNFSEDMFENSSKQTEFKVHTSHASYHANTSCVCRQSALHSRSSMPLSSSERSSAHKDGTGCIHSTLETSSARQWWHPTTWRPTPRCHGMI
jgi:dynein heavy chain